MILVDIAALDYFKRRLYREMPNVKHSHKLEAFARGCGFNTYAAMKAEDISEMREFSCYKFLSYLSSKGFAPEDSEEFIKFMKKERD